MREQLVLGGRFLVRDDGTVLRVAPDGSAAPATITHVGRNKKYCATSYTDDRGKHRLAYVHRMVAAAFIPNPEHKREVNHIDGNPLNNAADNLEWSTPGENTRHAVSTGLINMMANGSPCEVCGCFTKAHSGICPACYQMIQRGRHELDRIVMRRDRWGAIPLDGLTAKQRLYVLAARKGLSCEEIAEAYHCTRQNVSFELLSAERRAAVREAELCQS